jgi:hypothetical protein
LSSVREPSLDQLVLKLFTKVRRKWCSRKLKAWAVSLLARPSLLKLDHFFVRHTYGDVDVHKPPLPFFLAHYPS